MSSTNAKRSRTRAALKKELRGLFEGAGCWTLSLALTLSLVPPTAIAYAMEEGAPAESATSQPAENPQPQPEPEAPETPDTPEEPPAPEGGDDSGSGEEEAAPADEGGDKETPAAPSGEDKGGEESKGSDAGKQSGGAKATAKSTKRDAGGNAKSGSNDSDNKSDDAKSGNTRAGGSDHQNTKTETVYNDAPKPDDVKSALGIKARVYKAGSGAKIEDNVIILDDTTDTLKLSLAVEGSMPSGVKDILFREVDSNDANIEFTGGANNIYDVVFKNAPADGSARTYDLSKVTVNFDYTYEKIPTEVVTDTDTGDVISRTEKKDQATTETVTGSSGNRAASKEVNCTTGANDITSAVVDKKDPTIEVGINSQIVTTDGGVAYVAVTDDDKATITVTASDSDSGIESGSATLAGLAKKVTKQFDENGVATFGPYSAEDFINDDGSLRTATLTYTATDKAGRTVTTATFDGASGATEVKLASESAWLEDVAIAIDDSGVPSGNYADGTKVYRGDVKATVSGTHLDKLSSIEVIDAVDGSDTTLTGSGNDYTIAAVDGAKKSHVVRAVFETPHMTGNATKTVNANDTAFYIDMTKPTITGLTLSGNSADKTIDGQTVLLYKKDSTVTLDVAVTDDSTLNTTDPYKFEVLDGATPLAEGTYSVTGGPSSYVVKVDQEHDSKVLTVRVTPKTIFDDGFMGDPVTTQQAFMVDRSEPQIKLSFSGPMKEIDDGLGQMIAVFYKFWNGGQDTAQYKVGKVGALTITVTDDNLKWVKVDGVQKINSSTEQQPGADGSYTLEVPYVQIDGRVQIIGEGEGKDVTVTAQDDSGNSSTCSYNRDDRTETPGSPDGTTFDVDTESVQVTSFSAADTPKLIDGINVFATAKETFTVKVKDDHFDKKNTTLYAENNIGDKVTVSGDAWQGDENKDSEFTATFDLYESEDSDNPGKRVEWNVWIVANDKPGNKTTQESFTGSKSGYTQSSLWSGTIALDNTDPKVEIEMCDASGESKVSPTGDHNKTDYYDKEVTAVVTVTDPFFDADTTASAITGCADKGTWRGQSWDGSTDTGVYTAYVDYGENDTFGSTNELKATAKDQLNHATSKSYKNRKGDDNKGNDKFVVDLTDPAISVAITPDTVGPYDSTDYYVEETTATITVYDLNFDPDTSKVEPTEGTLQPGPDGKTWTDVDGAGTYSATIKYAPTPVHKTANFKITAVDYAKRTGKENTTYKNWKKDTKGIEGIDNFVVDTDEPETTVEIVEGDFVAKGSDGIDYYDDRTAKAKITVKDLHFAPKDSKVTLHDGGAIAEGKDANGWTEGPDGTWTAYVNYGENREGNYKDVTRSNLKVETFDKACIASGKSIDKHNQVKEYKDRKDTTGANEFIVDGTPVQVTVTVKNQIRNTVNSRDFYAETVVIELTAKDNNFCLAEANASKSINPKNATSTTKWKTTDDNRTYKRTITYAKETGYNNPCDLWFEVYDAVYKASSARSEHRTKYDYRQGDEVKTVNGTEYVKAHTVVSGAAGSATSFVVDKTPPEIYKVNNTASPSNEGGNMQFFNTIASLTYFYKDEGGLKSAQLNDPDGAYGQGPKNYSGETTASMPGVTLREFMNWAKDALDGKSSTVGSACVLRVIDLTGNYAEYMIDQNGKIVGVSTGNMSRGHTTINGLGKRPAALIYDHTAPRVSLSPKSLEGTFSNQTQTVTASIEEFNFHYLQKYDNVPGGTQIVKITKYEGNAGRAMSVRYLYPKDFNGSGLSWSHGEPFAEDGHYIVEIQFEDFAKNKSNYDKIGEFTIDKTPPRIDSIVFDNNNSVYNNGYYNAARTATITVTEHNWDSNLENSFITSNGQIIGWSHNGDTHIGTVVFGTDGDYNLSVRITDRAGNVSTTETVPEFTVDLTAPEMIIFNAAAEGETDTLTGHAYNKEIQPAVRFTDKTTGKQTFDPNNASLYSLELTPANGTADGSSLSYPTSSSSSGANDLTVVYDDFKRDVDYDDVYTFRTTMTDLAGNPAKILVSEQAVSDTDKGGAAEVKFSVNRFGSNFIVIDPERYTEKDGYMSPGDFNGEGSQPVQVAEINVSGFDEQGMGGNSDSYWDTVEKNHDVAVTHGLDTEELKVQRASEGDDNQGGYWVDDKSDVKDPKTQQSKVPNEWQVYTYNVYGPNFTKDGDYLVAVSSKDVATNDNVSGEYLNHDTKKIDKAQVSFVFDRTAPHIENVNLENGGLYDHGKYRTVAFSVKENYEMDIAKVLIDGEEAEVEYNEDEGMYYATIEAKSFTPRNIVITAIDRAGNEESFTIEGARVTNNIVELHWPSLLLLGAAGVGGGVYANRRRKKKNEEQAA